MINPRLTAKLIVARCFIRKEGLEVPGNRQALYNQLVKLGYTWNTKTGIWDKDVDQSQKGNGHV